MTHQTLRTTSGLLPQQIVALGTQQPDDDKAFRAANATYRAIRAIEAALSLRWLRVPAGRTRRATTTNRRASIS